MKRFIATALILAALWPSVGQAKVIEADAVEVDAEAVWWTEDDVDLLARLIYAEARGESAGGWKLVAQCALDRLEDGYWGDTLSDVIHSPGQFARPAKSIGEPEVFSAIAEVARAVLEGERYDEGLVILYFQRTKSCRDWYAGYQGHEGNHAYYGEKKED